MKEKDYKKAHSKTDQFGSRNNFPVVLNILINFLLSIAITRKVLDGTKQLFVYLELL